MTSTPSPNDPASNQPAPAVTSGEPANGAVSEGAPGPSSGNVGNALRSIYQRTIDEDVPDEMIDLLGRLD